MKTLKPQSILFPLLFLLPIGLVQADGLRSKVDIAVVSDDRGKLREYPMASSGKTLRSYIAVRDGETYRIRVSNHSHERIGLVIAVDGRNIITGRKSWLARNEAKYVLDPLGSAEYEGWRTSHNRVNRFYFTDIGDSYAEAWGDHSAMGVIAVAVYREKEQLYQPYRQPQRILGERAKGGAPGTGFGEGDWSPSHRVRFQARSKPALRKFIKYEWRETLCRKNVIAPCGSDPEEQGNRFWPDDGEYAPFPWEIRRR